MNKLSFKDAVRQWVGEFNAMPQALIEKAYGWEVCEHELTPIPKKYECENCSEEFDREEFDMAEENEYGDKLCQSCIVYTCDTCSEDFSEEEYNNAEVNEEGDKVCPTCLENEEEEIEFCTSSIIAEHSYIEEVEDHDAMEYGLPMWGTMWSFGSSLDDDWARNNLEVMADCGFKIYETDEIGIFFGIDGAGYDFYEAHWNRLYKARGLRWHDETTEKDCA